MLSTLLRFLRLAGTSRFDEDRDPLLGDVAPLPGWGSVWD
jgi:hypothetical protein